MLGPSLWQLLGQELYIHCPSVLIQRVILSLTALGFVPAAGKCQNQHSSPGLSALKRVTTLLNFAHLHCFSPTGEEFYETYGVL